MSALAELVSPYVGVRAFARRAPRRPGRRAAPCLHLRRRGRRPSARRPDRGGWRLRRRPRPRLGDRCRARRGRRALLAVVPARRADRPQRCARPRGSRRPRALRAVLRRRPGTAGLPVLALRGEHRRALDRRLGHSYRASLRGCRPSSLRSPTRSSPVAARIGYATSSGAACGPTPRRGDPARAVRAARARRVHARCGRAGSRCRCSTGAGDAALVEARPPLLRAVRASLRRRRPLGVPRRPVRARRRARAGVRARPPSASAPARRPTIERRVVEGAERGVRRAAPATRRWRCSARGRRWPDDGSNVDDVRRPHPLLRRHERARRAHGVPRRVVRAARRAAGTPRSRAIRPRVGRELSRPDRRCRVVRLRRRADGARHRRARRPRGQDGRARAVHARRPARRALPRQPAASHGGACARARRRGRSSSAT